MNQNLDTLDVVSAGSPGGGGWSVTCGENSPFLHCTIDDCGAPDSCLVPACRGVLFTFSALNLRYMVNKDYRIELGLVSPKKTVPRPVAILVLIVVAVALSWTAVTIWGEAKKRHAPAVAATAPASGAATQ